MDDEPSVIEGLRIFVNWNKLGFEIAGEAPDGAASFSVIQNIRPDLVICDIRMPGLNGLELIEKVNNEIIPAPKFIILSGYNDFSYAQKGIQLGALGFLTKPLDSEEIERELLRVVSIIDNERTARQENLELIRFTANQLYNDIMDGKRSEKIKRKAQFIFDIPDNSKICIVQFITDGGGNPTNYPVSNIYDLLMRITGIKNENCMFYNGNGSYIIVIHDGMEIFTSEAALTERLKKHLSSLDPKSYGFSSFWALVSGTSTEGVIDSIFSCGKRLEQLHTYCLLHPDKKVVYYSGNEKKKSLKDHAKTDAEIDFPELPFDSIINSLKGNDISQVSNSVNEFFDKLNNSGVSRRLYCICLYRLADLVRKMSYAYGVDGNSVILKFTRSINSMSPNCKILAHEMCEFIFKKQNINNEKPLFLLENEIIDFIKDNYRESLSLQSIAEKFSLSPIIISKIIKRKTGEKFNDYFNYLRIEHAKTLIASEDMKITSICEQCGYSDYSYFTEKFKEFTGVSPSEYKKKYS
ncbi:response regulator transcription factor [Ruminiclostridium cellobioparum]|uniref:Stage 0 sporulation protein A homolog n=1 Tax=Ruminiclostridium cellobioparum subsp. termitidis CT1112 TaxID=1195236 RepID=S0FT53_RUMCE|nr:response regulator [Ruminiclostridium cellobioparum]EMS71693.1 two component transcriptional regulator, AraC family protein [Ruminiclostridium cellobioparum subsp. termitidis CT1112]